MPSYHLRAQPLFALMIPPPPPRSLAPASASPSRGLISPSRSAFSAVAQHTVQSSAAVQMTSVTHRVDITGPSRSASSTGFPNAGGAFGSNSTPSNTPRATPHTSRMPPPALPSRTAMVAKQVTAPAAPNVYQDLKNRIAELQKDTVNQERRIAEKKNEVKVAEDRLEALRNERQSNLLVVHAVHGEISVLSSTLANLHARVVGIEAMHRDIVKENKHLHGVNAVTLDALATFEGKHTKLMSISHEVRGQVSAETQMLATKSAHHATVSANLENLKQEEIILQDSVSKAANEVVKVLDSNRQIEDMQGHHQLSCRSMQTQIAFAEQTLNNLQAREESLATEVFSLALSAQNTMARNETSRELELNNIAAATITAVRLAKEKIANCVEEYSQSSKKKAEQQKKYSRTRELAEKLRRVKIDVSNMHSQRVRLEQAKAAGEAKREQQRAVLRRYEETLRLKAMHGKILELGDEIAIALETALKSCQSVTAITPIVFTEIVRRLKTVEALSALAERFVGYDPSSKYERTSTTLRAQRTVMKSNWTPNAETGMGERDHDCGHSGQAIDGGRKPCHPYTKSEGKGFGHKAADDERVTAAHAERKATERRRTRSSVTNA